MPHTDSEGISQNRGNRIDFFFLRLKRKFHLGDSVPLQMSVRQIVPSTWLAALSWLKADRQLNLIAQRGLPAFPFQVKQVYMFPWGWLNRQQVDLKKPSGKSLQLMHWEMTGECVRATPLARVACVLLMP